MMMQTFDKGSASHVDDLGVHRSSLLSGILLPLVLQLSTLPKYQGGLRNVVSSTAHRLRVDRGCLKPPKRSFRGNCDLQNLKNPSSPMT
jgi:hypothetical protein